MDSLLAGNLILPLEGSLCRYDVQRRYTMENIPGIVKAIPGSGENRSPSRRNHCSPSARNPFRLHPGIVFTFTPESFSPSPGIRMPLELGLFLGCKRFGPPNQSKKRTLILDSDQYRYRTFISDISGQDIRAHRSDPERAIREVRDWLRLASKRTTLPGGSEIIAHYHRFQNDLPDMCAFVGLELDRLTFLDLSKMITDWLRTNR
jgi:hypothetical protein